MNPVWTDEAIAAAKKYNAERYSRSQIADKIFEDTGQRFTRDAVIGKLTRLGESCQKSKQVRNHAHNRPVRAPVNSLHVTREKKFNIPKAGRLVQALFFDSAEYDAARPHAPVTPAFRAARTNSTVGLAPLHIPYLEQRDGECKFICSPDGAPRTVCGHPQTATPRLGRMVPSSYCPFHHGFTHMGFGEDRRRERRGA